MSDRQSVVPQPNFLGGFLCGFLGVLAFAWLGEIAMWIAGTLGFVIGCWPREICLSLTSAYRACASKSPDVCKGLLAFEHSPILRAARYVFTSKYRCLYCLRVVIVLALSLPWLIAAVAVPTLMIRNMPESESQASAMAISVLVVPIFVVVCSLLPLLAILMPLDQPGAGGVGYQRNWICYLKSLRCRRVHHGLLYCVGYDVWGTIKRQLAMAFVLIFGACTGLLLLVAMAAVTLVVLIIRGVLLLNSHASGIICLVLALLATACSAWTLSDYLSGTLLWVIAVGTGCFAGSATVAGRELVIRALPYASDRVHAFAKQTIASRIEPLTELWLKPERIIWTIAVTCPEAA